MQFFRHREVVDHPQPVPARPAVPERVAEREIKAAYADGRRDERRRRRHPFLALGVSVVALAGVGLLGLAAMEGSFSRSGEVVDQKLAVVADQAQVASRDAAVATGEAVRDTSTVLRQRVSTTRSNSAS